MSDSLSDGAQIPAQDLADRGLGQRVEEAHLLRDLVAREIELAVRDDLLVGQTGVRGLHNEEPHRFAGLLVGRADAGAFGHARAGSRHGFDFVGIDVEARHQDHVLLAVHDLEVARSVKDADIAGAEVPVGGECPVAFASALSQ
jgi:hypothetical protein